MKVEINHHRELPQLIESEKDGIEICEETVHLDKTSIRGIIRATGCPIFSMCLADAEIVTSLLIRNKTNGSEYNLAEHLFGDVDIVKIDDDWIINFEMLAVKMGVELDEEQRNWMTHLLKHNSSMPKAKAIQVGFTKSVDDIPAALHESAHVALGHVDEVSNRTLDGARQIISQENQASERAMVEFIQIAERLSLGDEAIVRAKRLLDALYYSYQIGFESFFGEENFGEFRKLDLSEAEKKLFKNMLSLIEMTVA